MATSLTINSLKAEVGWQYSQPNVAGNPTTDQNKYTYFQTLAQGTGAGNSKIFYQHTYTLAASASQDVDLAGAVADVFGNTVTFAKVKIIYVELQTTTTATSIYVGGSSSNGFINWISSAGTFATDQPKITVRNGGVFLLACTDATGYAVTAGTADILKLTNADGANSATVRVAIVGE